MHPALKTAISLFVLSFLLFLNTLKFILSPVLRAIFAPRKALTIRTPDSRFSGLEKHGYTFTPNYVDLPMGGEVSLPRMHYIDEGPKDAQETILCLHGEPSWSFLYRKMVPTLVQARYRVVVPDFIGFGKSDKYTAAANYTHELHTASLRMLIDHLELTNITLVCQDWGGLTGLSVVKDIPDKFCSLVVMNTGLPTGDLIGIPFLLWRNFATLLGNYIPIKFVFKTLIKFPDDIAEAYDAPFPDASYKAGAAQWPILVPLYKDDTVAPHMVAARNFLKTWQKPMLIMFSDKDPITRGQEKMFKNLVPKAKEVRIHGAGHFLQETHGEELAKNVVQFRK